MISIVELGPASPYVGVPVGAVEYEEEQRPECHWIAFFRPDLPVTSWGLWRVERGNCAKWSHGRTDWRTLEAMLKSRGLMVATFEKRPLIHCPLF